MRYKVYPSSSYLSLSQIFSIFPKQSFSIKFNAYSLGTSITFKFFLLSSATILSPLLKNYILIRNLCPSIVLNLDSLTLSQLIEPFLELLEDQFFTRLLDLNVEILNSIFDIFLITRLFYCQSLSNFVLFRVGFLD